MVARAQSHPGLRSGAATLGSQNPPPLLRIEQAGKIYDLAGQPVRALENVSLQLHPGALAALVGRSGCGKSTLLNLAGAMDFPTSGEVWLDGVCTSRLSEAGLTRLRRERVGFVFQSFQLFPTLTVAENVELPLQLAGRRGARQSALAALEWVQLGDKAGRYPHQLSGGEMQRVAIARAIVHRPRLLLADEPTGNLDTVTGNRVLDLLWRAAEEHQTAVLMATHSEEAAGRASIVFYMRDGRIENVLRR